MREFVIDTLVPFGAVCTTVAVITLAAFDPPPPPPKPVDEPRAAPAPRPSAKARQRVPDRFGGLPAGTLRPREKQMRKMTDVFQEAARNLSTKGSSPAATPTEEQGESISEGDRGVISAVSNLGAAIKRARDAKDEKDLEAAEVMLRRARKDMEIACRGGNSPLCQSAEQMKSLGY